jgi:histidyl-tRNA synthetase
MLSTQPYKGVRDFYPDEFKKRQYIFDTWRSTLVKTGFSEYDASILEPANLYTEKSGEELGSKQLYSFTDKGDREVALRPEWTPTLARMVSAKFGEIAFPLRWFCIPNCFRYERPQKGRLREFWQLNADIIGLEAGLSDLEILRVLSVLFESFKAPKESYSIRYNHRGLLDMWIVNEIGEDKKQQVYDLLDSWKKLDDRERKETMLEQGFTSEQSQKIQELANCAGLSYETYLTYSKNFTELATIQSTISEICPNSNFIFDPTIVRGIAYYTGLVFEAFDENPENSRALFGGGRYDNLLELFGKHAPAIGFGWGDVTMGEFLTNWDLWPSFEEKTTTGVMVENKESIPELYTKILPELETKGVTYIVDYDTERSENKRWQALKKKGCGEIIKV